MGLLLRGGERRDGKGEGRGRDGKGEGRRPHSYTPPNPYLHIPVPFAHKILNSELL